MNTRKSSNNTEHMLCDRQNIRHFKLSASLMSLELIIYLREHNLVKMNTFLAVVSITIFLNILEKQQVSLFQ